MLAIRIFLRHKVLNANKMVKIVVVLPEKFGKRIQVWLGIVG